MFDNESLQKLEQAVKTAPYGQLEMAFLAGVMSSLAISSQYPLEDQDRIYLARAGEMLRRAAFAQYFQEHGELP